MGIQINGNTNNINAGIGSLSIEDINELDIVGVATAANFKTGVSNLHSLGLTLSGGQLDVGNNIKLGNAGVVTATTAFFSGNITANRFTGTDGNAIFLGDSKKIVLGTGSDLEIYHASNQNYVTVVGDGNLNLTSATSVVIKTATSKDAVVCNNGGSTDLYHNNSKKFETTSSGATVTGTLTATAFSGDGSNLTGITGTTINSNANNRVITGSGTANTLEAEANLTFTGSILTVTNSSGASELTLVTPSANDSGVYFNDGSNAGALTYNHSDNSMRFRVNSTEKVRIHSSGQVYIGHYNFIADHDALLVVKPNITDSSRDSIGILVDGDSGTGGGQSSPSMGIKIVNTNTWNNATHQYGLYNEVGQQYISSNTGIYNKVTALYGTTKGHYIELNKNLNAYTNGYALSLNIKPTGSGGTNYFIDCQKDDSNLKMRVLQNGNLQNANNSYGSTSDVKLKENIVDANSQWDDIKSLRVRNFNFKDDPDKIKMLGVVAQEAEAVSAGLVETDNDIEVDETTGEGKVVGTTKFVKYSILYMKAVKCLQEAQAKIETLEAKVSALEGS